MLSITRTMGLRILGTWVYLSMNMSALGTLWSPRWTTEDPTQLPMRLWHMEIIPHMAL